MGSNSPCYGVYTCSHTCVSVFIGDSCVITLKGSDAHYSDSSAVMSYSEYFPCEEWSH